MSVQFGRWNLDGKPIDVHYFDRVGETLTPYGPDGKTSYDDRNISILYHAFHTTKEALSEVQPYVCASGAVITWDGRLDNRAELIGELGDSLTTNSADVAIVAKAYDNWATRCFTQLIGDWALSIWSANSRSLILAKDPIGTRHLYYLFGENHITWSTILEPLVRLSGKTFDLNEEYIAGWISMYPATHLTPYSGIHSVPPSSFVQLRPATQTVSKYWDFEPKGKVRYRSDNEYEQRFRDTFSAAVRRRLRSHTPILAELSGGRDSSAIVCMADKIAACGAADTPRIDTLSWYDDAEPQWDDRAYFTRIERERGRAGWHIDVGSQDSAGNSRQHLEFSDGHFVSKPGDNGRTSSRVRSCLTSRRNRVILSGLGGDEFMGGVPTPAPELQDLIAQARLRDLSRQLKLWALQKRKPWFHVMLETVAGFLPPLNRWR